MFSGSAAQSIWSDVKASSRPFQSIPLCVPFSFLSPTRHCTKWCFVSRQRTVSPPLVTPDSALPSCPMASAPIRIYCLCGFIPLAGRGLCSAQMSNMKGVLAWLCNPARTLTHPDGLKRLEGGQVGKKKHSQKKGREEHGGVLNVPLTFRK